MRGSAALVPALAIAAQSAPALSSVPWVRRTLTPRLAGISRSVHLALTYDDGPDPVSTPHFLDLLEHHRRSATFFLLGEHAAAYPDLVRHMTRLGHEVAVHGWDHRCLAAKRPGRLLDELKRTRGLLEDITGAAVRWYRPPYGVVTSEGLLAARAAGLQTVLWTAWGRDWTASATPQSIRRTVLRSLKPGGTVLLHDTDRTSAPLSWQNTLRASSDLLDDWTRQEVPLGSLSEHWA
ncbi:MAG: polysaccharide deacetylase [Nocardioides sp.]|nr:polysaccharide deacetylase [Nocardioides sp.]